MTFASMTNLLLTLLCVGVLVQSARLMRSVRAVRSSDLGDMVQHLGRATDRAHDVLADLRRLLSTDTQANMRVLSSAETLRDELSVMVGIGNAVADRIMEAADKAVNGKTEKAGAGAKSATALPARPKRTRGSSGYGGRGVKKVVNTASELIGPPIRDAAIPETPVPSSASITVLSHVPKAA